MKCFQNWPFLIHHIYFNSQFLNHVNEGPESFKKNPLFKIKLSQGLYSNEQ